MLIVPPVVAEPVEFHSLVTVLLPVCHGKYAPVSLGSNYINALLRQPILYAYPFHCLCVLALSGVSLYSHTVTLSPTLLTVPTLRIVIAHPFALSRAMTEGRAVMP